MTRLGKNGTKVVRGGGLAAAFFPHDMSRELDPQNHIHAVVFNFTKGPDGKYRSLDASKLYEHKRQPVPFFAPSLRRDLRSLALRLSAIAFRSPSREYRRA